MFKTYADMKKQLTETQVLELVNKALANQAYRKQYNKQRNAMMALVKEQHPELFKRQ